MATSSSEAVPKEMETTYQEIVALTDAFCKERLDEEYAALCRRMAARLARKRPSPLLSGKPNTWAAGIVHAVAGLNFLFDKSEPKYLSAAEIATAFGVSKSTSSARSTAIHKALAIDAFDWHWSVPSRVDDYPGAWLIQVDGLIVDARMMPLDVQEEAFARGYIPYVPGRKRDQGVVKGRGRVS